MVNWDLYAAALQDEFISMVKGDLRRSSSDALSPFWQDPPAPGSEEIGDRYQASSDFRAVNNLLRICESDFIGQIIPDKSQAFFETFVSAMGIEAVTVDDIYSESPDSRLPEVPGMTEVIRVLVAKGFAIDKDALEATYPSVDLSEVAVLHIDEPLPSQFGEEDSIIAGKMAKARIYTRLYIEKNQNG